jgi:DNA-binding PadR family transcriptional regulator
MSVRHGLLALLAHEPMHASQLRQQFERRTGGTWPLNQGQVSTTLQRLVRDGLVETGTDLGAHDGAGDTVSGGEPGRERYHLTSAGRAEAAAWWRTPVDRGAPARDELAIKLALAVTTPGVDVAAVVQAQRTETLRALRDYTRLSARAGGDDGARPDDDATDLAWSLVLDSLVFAAEAEVRWLDHVEARLRRRGVGHGATASSSAPADTTRTDTARTDSARTDSARAAAPIGDAR